MNQRTHDHMFKWMLSVCHGGSSYRSDFVCGEAEEENDYDPGIMATTVERPWHQGLKNKFGIAEHHKLCLAMDRCRPER